MKTILPGTTIEIDSEKFYDVDSLFTPLFLAGGLMMSQVSQITGLEGYVIQNWVKRGFLTSPVEKKYSRNQLCRIIIINMLKDSMQLDKIVHLLTYMNGILDLDEDDNISDSDLYGYFCRILGEYQVSDHTLDEIIPHHIETYKEIVPGMRKKLHRTLKIMELAYHSSQLQKQAYSELAKLDDYKPETNKGGIINDKLVEQPIRS